jgi:hypothetical protein
MEQEPKTPRERAEDLIRLLVPDWRPTNQQVLWGIRIVLAFVLVLGVLTIAGRPFGITLWQWLDLLIIPAVLGIGGYLFTRSENLAARVVAERRAQDEALQAYLDQMGQMLLDNDAPLRQSDQDSEVGTLARARTLTVLPRLDGDRKTRVVQFLYESGLIAKGRPILALGGADLIEADLIAANLRYANLSDADLREADLTWAYLEYAKLNGAYVTDEQLAQCLSLKGATMPDGQRYEDWPERKDRGEASTNSGP